MHTDSKASLQTCRILFFQEHKRATYLFVNQSVSQSIYLSVYLSMHEESGGRNSEAALVREVISGYK